MPGRVEQARRVRERKKRWGDVAKNLNVDDFEIVHEEFHERTVTNTARVLESRRKNSSIGLERLFKKHKISKQARNKLLNFFSSCTKNRVKVPRSLYQHEHALGKLRKIPYDVIIYCARKNCGLVREKDQDFCSCSNGRGDYQLKRSDCFIYTFNLVESLKHAILRELLKKHLIQNNHPFFTLSQP